MNNQSHLNHQNNAAYAKTKGRYCVQSSRYVRMINEVAYYRADQHFVLPGYELLEWLETEEKTKRHFWKALF